MRGKGGGECQREDEGKGERSEQKKEWQRKKKTKKKERVRKKGEEVGERSRVERMKAGLSIVFVAMTTTTTEKKNTD